MALETPPNFAPNVDEYVIEITPFTHTVPQNLHQVQVYYKSVSKYEEENNAGWYMIFFSFTAISLKQANIFRYGKKLSQPEFLPNQRHSKFRQLFIG